MDSFNKSSTNILFNEANIDFLSKHNKIFVDSFKTCCDSFSIETNNLVESLKTLGVLNTFTELF